MGSVAVFQALIPRTETLADDLQLPQLNFIDQLVDKTRKRSITWEPTAKNDEFVSALGGRVSFTVASWRDGDVLMMRDELDRVLLNVDSDSIPQVSELYREARRVALRVDESLDDVLDQLGKMDG
jgi:hypothetical protein